MEAGLEIHVILDNLATHKHAKLRAWLRRHPRVHLHFVPTGASWLNLVEILFRELELRKLKRLAVNSVGELATATHNYLEHRNTDPKPFTWTKFAKEIIAKIERGLQILATVH